MANEIQASVRLTRQEAALLYDMIDTRIQNIAREGIDTTANARAFREGLRQKLVDAICEISKRSSRTMKPETKDPLEPRAMTKKWISKRTDAELKTLAKRWPDWCCRGISIRDEIRKRSS